MGAGLESPTKIAELVMFPLGSLQWRRLDATRHFFLPFCLSILDLIEFLLNQRVQRGVVWEAKKRVLSLREPCETHPGDLPLCICDERFFLTLLFLILGRPHVYIFHIEEQKQHTHKIRSLDLLAANLIL